MNSQTRYLFNLNETKDKWRIHKPRSLHFWNCETVFIAPVNEIIEFAGNDEAAVDERIWRDLK